MTAYSDMSEVALRSIGQAFMAAHKAAPGGLSIEIGSRSGGSAYLFLTLLRKLYQEGNEPFLFTVDPYGAKMYPGPNPAPIYEEEHFVALKKALASIPNHSHFLMTSLEFFERMYGCAYWVPGEIPYVDETGSKYALGEEKRMGQLSFCLLDGDHILSTIRRELHWLFSAYTHWMSPNGIAVVDNVEFDSETESYLSSKFNCTIESDGTTKWAVIKGLRNE